MNGSTSARIGAPWRRGRSVGRTLYNADELLIGVMDTPELAAVVCDAVNTWAHSSDTRTGQTAASPFWPHDPIDDTAGNHEERQP